MTLRKLDWEWAMFASSIFLGTCTVMDKFHHNRGRVSRNGSVIGENPEPGFKFQRKHIVKIAIVELAPV